MQYPQRQKKKKSFDHSFSSPINLKQFLLFEVKTTLTTDMKIFQTETILKQSKLQFMKIKPLKTFLPPFFH